MGGTLSKGNPNPCKEWGDQGELKEKIQALEIEVHETKNKRLQERRRLEAAFAAREEEWKREKQRLQKQIDALCSYYSSPQLVTDRKIKQEEEDEEEEITVMTMKEREKDKEWQLLGANFLVEHMREEHARKAEAVEKWKRLYLAIKNELDDLIRRTALPPPPPPPPPPLRNGTYVEEEIIERLQKELEAKEEMMEMLRAQLKTMEKEGTRREMEIDILRQSLRIMSNSKKTQITKNLSRSLHL